MKNCCKISFLLIIILCWSGSGANVNAQNNNIDSLLTLLKKDQPDTNKVNHLNKLSKEYLNVDFYDSAIYFANQALALANYLPFENGRGWEIGVADASANLGIIYLGQDNYSGAIDHFLKSLKIHEELKNKRRIANLKGNIGIVYKKQGAYLKALDYYFNAQKLYEELGDKIDIAVNLGNIANVYKQQSEYAKALEYYFASQKLYEELELKKNIGLTFGNIGGVYFKQGDYPQALEYIFQSLKIAEELGDKRGTATHLGNIGNIYQEQASALPTSNKKSGELFSKALAYYFKALKMHEELGSKNFIASNINRISSVYVCMNKYKEAFDYGYRALTLSENIGAKEIVKDCYTNLSLLYENSTIPLLDSFGGKLLTMEQMRLRSMYYYKRSMAIRDELFSQENKKELVRKEMNYEFEKKEAFTKAENEKQHAIAQEKSRKQKLVLILVSFVLILVFVFAGFIFRSLRITRKQKQIIEIKNTQTEEQKKVIEEKNKDITDSIRYAKRIQDALMGEKEHISTHLPEHFILFMPKDIVSGDFHWGAEKQGHWYFAAVDCTGHGVPGAVMSMLGISFLNDIVASEQLHRPAEVLNHLRDKVVKELRQTGETGGSKDGMDISLCRLNLETNELQWAGAYNPLNLFRNGRLEELKGDKQPIGYHPESRPFTNHEIQLKKGDTIYLYSDGYADQFGGPKGKKFKYKQLEELIITNNNLSMEGQKLLLKKHFTEWKGSLEQIDDVCVFGIRV